MGQKAPQNATAAQDGEEDQAGELTPGTEVFLDAFSFLQTARQPSMGEALLPIPATAMLAYADAYGWVGQNRFVLIEVLRAVDMAYIDHYNTKGKSKHARNQKKVVS